MEGLEQEVIFLLNGEAVTIETYDIKSKKLDPNFVPLIKRTICYIVCGVLFNEKGEVLMMQEAKQSCYGKWYLPAGRMEPNETLEEGVKREVLEETGLEFEPETLLSVELSTGIWFRFTFTGRVTGGSLKTTKNADSESLQAKWCSLNDLNFGIPLRANDVLPLIHLADDYRKQLPEIRHASNLPVINPHKSLLLRIVTIHKDKSGELYLLHTTGDNPHLPVYVISPRDASVATALRAVMHDAFEDQKENYTSKVMGVLTVEHAGKPERENDGVCVTLLMKLKPINEEEFPKCVSEKYTLTQLKNSELVSKLSNRLNSGMNVKFIPLR